MASLGDPEFLDESGFGAFCGSTVRLNLALTTCGGFVSPNVEQQSRSVCNTNCRDCDKLYHEAEKRWWNVTIGKFLCLLSFRSLRTASSVLAKSGRALARVVK